MATKPYEFGRGDISPFPPQSGVVLVCGNGFSLLDDFARARKLFPQARVIAVNGAARHVPADFLYTMHPRKMTGWMAEQALRFGDRFTTHASGRIGIQTKLGIKVPNFYQLIDYWWPEARSPGSSGWGARRLARLMGFDQVVLCGVPLSVGNYERGKWAKAWQNPEKVAHYQAAVRREADYHDGVTSMSGWTRDFFGEPNGSNIRE